MPSPIEPSPGTTNGLAGEVAALRQVAFRDRWGLAFIAIGWTHLAIFLVCHLLFRQGDRAESHFLPLWGLDLALAILILKRSLGARSTRPPLVMLGVAIRVWITYFLLCFTAVSLNKLTGLGVAEWFKISWAGLATFGFAMMAWLFHLGFLIPAVQMSLTSLLIARFPEEAYWIFGLSWALALNGLGLAMERERWPSRMARPVARARAVGAGSRAEIR